MQSGGISRATRFPPFAKEEVAALAETLDFHDLALFSTQPPDSGESWLILCRVDEWSEVATLLDFRGYERDLINRKQDKMDAVMRGAIQRGAKVYHLLKALVDAGRLDVAQAYVRALADSSRSRVNQAPSAAYAVYQLPSGQVPAAVPEQPPARGRILVTLTVEGSRETFDQAAFLLMVASILKTSEGWKLDSVVFGSVIVVIEFTPEALLAFLLELLRTGDFFRFTKQNGFVVQRVDVGGQQFTKPQEAPATTKSSQGPVDELSAPRTTLTVGGTHASAALPIPTPTPSLEGTAAIVTTHGPQGVDEDDTVLRGRSALADVAEPSLRACHEVVAVQFHQLKISLRHDVDFMLWGQFSETERKSFCQGLECFDLEPFDPATSAPFAVNILQNRLTIGPPLLRPLCVQKLSPEHIQRFAILFILHEMLHHLRQRIYSSSYEGIGRADVVLEELDYVADAFALLVGAAFYKRAHRDARPLHEIVRDFINTAIRGMEAFDRMEQKGNMHLLPERRLRRYLIWNIQHELVTRADTNAKLTKLLGLRLSAQIAPIRCSLDRTRFEKVIEIPDRIEEQTVAQAFLEAHRNAELFVTVHSGSQLFRYPGNSYGPVAKLVVLIACFNWTETRNYLHRYMSDMVPLLEAAE